MTIEFRTRQLRNQYEEHKKAVKAYGVEVAKKYVLRINILKSARTFDDVRSLPGLGCHELQGKLKGLWAVKLTGKYRLLFRVEGEQLDIVRIEDVSVHYGD